jgi:hypothetical protein
LGSCDKWSGGGQGSRARVREFDELLYAYFPDRILLLLLPVYPWASGTVTHFLFRNGVKRCGKHGLSLWRICNQKETPRKIDLGIKEWGPDPFWKCHLGPGSSFNSDLSISFDVTGPDVPLYIG